MCKSNSFSVRNYKDDSEEEDDEEQSEDEYSDEDDEAEEDHEYRPYRICE